MALVAILLCLSACGSDRADSDDYVDDANGKRQLTDSEYVALKKFLAEAERTDASGVSDLSRAYVSVNGERYQVYWQYLCPSDERTNALHAGGIEFTKDKNVTVDLSGVIAWAEKNR